MRTRVLTTRLIAGLAVVLLCGHASLAGAQTSMVPYFGKNNPHYDKFEWHIYTTDHFEIYYYPALESQLERIAGYAESAYQQISADLKHDLPAKVPMILFKTASEFQENHGWGETRKACWRSPSCPCNRMVLLIDMPSDQLYGPITHELTHVFAFEIIPLRPACLTTCSLWMDEGLAEYMRGVDPPDQVEVRSAALSDSAAQDDGGRGRFVSGAGQPYYFGHGMGFHRVEVGQGRAAPVPVRAAQERHRRRRERLRRGVQAEARRVRRAVRPVPEGPVQALPRQGAAVRPAGAACRRTRKRNRRPRAT